MKKFYFALIVVCIAVFMISSIRFISITSNNVQNYRDFGAKGNLSVDTNSSIISLQELSKHNSLQNCWVGYSGKVYDITSFLPNHKGSAQAILSYCGTAKEFEQAFIAQHGTTKVNLLMKVGTFMGYFDIRGGLTQ